MLCSQISSPVFLTHFCRVPVSKQMEHMNSMDPDAAAHRPPDIESTGSMISGFMRKLSPASTDRAKIADEASTPPAPAGIEGQESEQEKDHVAAVDVESITPSVAPADAVATTHAKSATPDAPPTKENKSHSAKEKSTVPTLAIKWKRTGKPRKGEDALSGEALVAALREKTRSTLAELMPLADGSTWHATVVEPAIVLTSLQSRKLKSAGVAIGLGGVVLGGLLVLLLQALVGRGSDQTIAPPPPALPAALDLTLDNDTCFEAQITTTASPLTRAAFVPTFFNLSCIAGGGTGDPCDAQIAEDYTHRSFSALRFVRAPLAAYRMRCASSP